MIPFKRRFVLMYPDAGAAAAGGGGGGDGGAAAAAAAAAAGGGGDKGGGDKGGDKGSLLSQAGTANDAAAQAAAAAAADPNAWIPEKYRVFEGEGDAKKFNLEQSARKVAAAHSDLEKRMGALGAPPAKPEDYKADGALASLKEKAGKDVKLPDGLVKEFNAWAHGAQLSQAQYDKALVSYVHGIQTMVDTAFDNAMQTAQSELVKVWGADGIKADSPQMKAAHRAFMTYAPQGLRTQQVMDQIGNNPVVLQVLSAVGMELGEDTRTHGEGAAADDVQKLINSEAYWKKTHPEHAATVRKVNAFFASGGKLAAQGGRQAAG